MVTDVRFLFRRGQVHVSVYTWFQITELTSLKDKNLALFIKHNYLNKYENKNNLINCSFPFVKNYSRSEEKILVLYPYFMLAFVG